MIYSINFVDLTEKINPLAFSRYLKDTGWNLFDSKKKNIKIYQFEETEDIFFQVKIPMENTLKDYKEAMYKAVEIVAEKEKRSVEQLMLYLLNPNTDILKIRLNKKEVEAGNILFDDAIHMYENVKKLLAATALDIINPRKYHQGRIDESVNKFLASCRFGQTEIGSYVVSVVCPFAELNGKDEYEQLSIFSDEEKCANSLTRKVTNRVMNNIYDIKQHIDNDEMEKLLPRNNDIISANFYEALTGLNMEADDVTIEFIAEWSPVVKNTTCKSNRVELTHDYYQPIVATINKIKEEKNKATRIIGRIKRLESSPDVKTRKMGKIAVVYLDENDKARTVTAKLDKNDYNKAIEAHEKGLHVEIVGELTGGKNATISCESFSIID